MPREFETAIIHANSPTVNGEAAYEVALPHDLGQVRGCAIVLTSKATGGVGSWDATELSWSWGVASLDSSSKIDQRIAGGHAEDGVATMNVGRWGSDALVVQLFSGDGSTELLSATVKSFDINGITVKWATNTSTEYHMTVVLFGGTDCECQAFDQGPGGGGAGVIVDVGFAPDLIMGAPFFDTTATVREHLMIGANFATRANPVNGNVSGNLYSTNNLATSHSETVTLTAFQAAPPDYTADPYTFGWLTGTIDWSATGFTVTGLFDGGDGTLQPIIGLAIKHGSEVESGTFVRNVPNGAATVGDLNLTGGRPGFIAMALAGNIVGNIPLKLGSLAIGYHQFLPIAITEAWGAIHRHGVASSQSGQFYDDGNGGAEIVRYFFGDAAFELATIDITDRDEVSFEITTANALSLSLHYAVLVIDEAAFKGFGVATLPSLTAVGAADEEFRATSATTLPSLTAAGTATTFDAAGAVTLPSLAAAAAADEVFATDAGATTLPSLAASGAALLDHRATSAVTLPSIEADADAIEVFAAAAAATLPSLTATGAAVSFSAVGAVTLPSLVAAGQASELFATVGAATLPSLVAVGTGIQGFEFSRVGIVILPSLAANGLAVELFASAAVVTLPSLAAAGTARSFDAAGVVILPALGPVVGAALFSDFGGVGAVTLPSLEAFGVADRGGPDAIRDRACYDGSADARADLVGTAAAQAVLVGSSDNTKALTGTSVARAELVGTYDQVGVFTGTRESC